MNVHERAQIWAQKDQLFRALSQLSVSDGLAQTRIREQLAACDQRLSQARQRHSSKLIE